jgi:hypothetical protein
MGHKIIGLTAFGYYCNIYMYVCSYVSALFPVSLAVKQRGLKGRKDNFCLGTEGDYYRSGCITEVVALQRWRWLHYGAGCIRRGCITELAILEVIALQRWLYYRGGCITELAVLEVNMVALQRSYITEVA